MGATDDKVERFGPFVLLRTLGVGGMGTAHLAMHAGTDGLLVVKRMHPTMVSEPTLFKRFVHEAEVASHVQHPNVAALVAMGAVEGEPFLATEYVFGIQVSQIVERVMQAAVDPLPMQVALQVAIELTSGLQAIHEARHKETGAVLGLVHRDVGSRNVLVGFDGRVRLIDLGLGKSILADWQTSAEVLAGSPDYMPPEQAVGTAVDARADVYAAAVTIWEVITGAKRIREDTVAARVQRAVVATPEPLRKWRPDASRGLERLLWQAMEPDRDDRLSTAAELRAGLESELRRIQWFERRDGVRDWLDAACATIIARERRALQQLQASVADLGEVPSQVEIYVGDVQGWVPASAAPTAGGPASSAAPEPIPPSSMIQWTGLVIARATRIAMRIGLPGDVSRVPLAHLLAVFVSFVSVVCLAAAATVWWMMPASPGPRVRAEALSPRPSTALQPPSAPSGALEPVPAEATAPVDPAVPAAPVVRARPRLPGLLQTQKNGLLVRLKELRKVKYEVSWQRKLTGLSARLSRAQTRREIAAIEVALNRLEKSRADP